MTNPYASPTTDQLRPSSDKPPQRGLSRAIYFWIIAGLIAIRAFLLGGIPLFELASVFMLIVATGYRCSNVGMNPKWCLALFIPILNLFVLGRCLICQEGYMEQKRLDLIGKIGFGFFLAFVGLMLFSWFAVSA